MIATSVDMAVAKENGDIIYGEIFGIYTESPATYLLTFCDPSPNAIRLLARALVGGHN